MIELTLYEYLKTALSIPVFMEYPEDTSIEKFVILQKIDAGITNQIKAATFAVDVYAPSLYETAQLSEIVKAAMFNSTSIDEISSVRLGGEQVANDTQYKKYMYASTFNLFHY